MTKIAMLVSACAIAATGWAAPVAEIVVPAKADRIATYAADELKYHLEKATCGSVEIVCEVALKPSATRSAPIFYVGGTEAAKRAGIDKASLADEEYVVKGAAGAVYLLGGDRDSSHGKAEFGSGSGLFAYGTLYAVYDFLEKDMGVKWIWPGETGEVIPRRGIPALDGVERRHREPLVLRKFAGEPSTDKMPEGGSMMGWADVANARKDAAARRKWLVRHRLGARRAFNGSHAFADWWGKYGKTHPEYFNLLPNGMREPLKGDSTGKNVTLCVSQPALWRQIVQDWLKSGKSRTKDGYYVACVNCCENDTPGLCTCPQCRAWDAPDPKFAEHGYWNGSGDDPLTLKGRFRRLADVQWGETGGTRVLSALPQVSDRYLRFYNSVLAEARKHVPEAEVYGYAYANYLSAPKRTKVSDGVVISFVPRMFFPYTAEESENFRREWTGWREAGAKQMIYRPNYMLAGANLPYCSARRIASDVAFASRNGMMAINQDSLTGTWSAHCMQNYAVTRLMREPEAGYEKTLDEFASAFHPAEAEIKKYCAFLEDVGKGLSVEDWQEIGQRNKGRDGNAGGGFKNYVLAVADVYSPEWFAKASALLDSVAAKAAADASGMALRRVDFLRKGLEDARLTYLTRVAQKGGDKDAFDAAFKRMCAYRASVESEGICSYYSMAFREKYGAAWPHR